MVAGLILDAALLLIIILTVIISAKHGFVRSFVEVAGLVVALIIVYNVSTPISETIYNKKIEPAIVRSTQNVVVDSTENTVDKVWEALPKTIKDFSQKIGIGKENITKNVDISDNVAAVTDKASEAVVKPVVTKLLSALIMLVAFVVLVPLVKFLAKFINKLFSISFVGRVNMFFGGALGVIKGIVFAVVFTLIVGLLVISLDDYYIFTKSAVNSSHIFKYIYGFIPLFK